VDEKNSSIYRVSSLARLNVADGMATPAAQEAYTTMYDSFGRKPMPNTPALHCDRLVESVYTAERTLELIRHPKRASQHGRRPGRSRGGNRLRRSFPRYSVSSLPGGRKEANHQSQPDSSHRSEQQAVCMSIKKAAQTLTEN